jgi:ribosomal protein L13E
LDARIDARVADACGLTVDERRRVCETLASVSEWTALRRPSG